MPVFITDFVDIGIIIIMFALGFGKLDRAELALVKYQIISVEVFYTLMLTCFFLNISVPLSIRGWKMKFSADS